MITKNLWYPNYFICEGYSLFASKRQPFIDGESNKHLENISLTELFTSDILPLPINYVGWDSTLFLTIQKLSQRFNDDRILLIKHDYMLEDPKIYRSFDAKLFFDISPSPILNIYEGNIQTNDTGQLLWGDSEKWAYYYGEELYLSTNLEEFDLFIIKSEFNNEFIEILKDSLEHEIELVSRNAIDFFNVDANKKILVQEIIHIFN